MFTLCHSVFFPVGRGNSRNPQSDVYICIINKSSQLTNLQKFAYLFPSSPRLEDIIRRQGKRFLTTIEETNGRDLDAYNITNTTNSLIVTRILTGIWYEPNDKSFTKFNRTISRMFELVGPAALAAGVPVLSKIPSPQKFELKQLTINFLDFVDEAINIQKANFDPKTTGKDYLTCYLKAMNEFSTPVNTLW